MRFKTLNSNRVFRDKSIPGRLNLDLFIWSGARKKSLSGFGQAFTATNRRHPQKLGDILYAIIVLFRDFKLGCQVFKDFFIFKVIIDVIFQQFIDTDFFIHVVV